jgi:HlyD family secretion protein
MKRKPAIGIFLLILLGAATLYFFFFTEHSRGLIIEGIVDANQVVVSPKVQGLLERLVVDEGSKVRAGEPIARLDTAELSAEVEADRAGVENMRAQLAQSQSNYQLALVETAGDLAGAQARLSAASAQLAQSESQLQRVRNDQDRDACDTGSLRSTGSRSYDR